MILTPTIMLYQRRFRIQGTASWTLNRLICLLTTQRHFFLMPMELSIPQR